MDNETKEFYENLLQSVREMKENWRAKETVIGIDQAGLRFNPSFMTVCLTANLPTALKLLWVTILL